MRVNGLSSYNPIKTNALNQGANLGVPTFGRQYQSTKYLLGYSNRNIRNPETQEECLSEKDREFLASLDLNEEESETFEKLLKFENRSARRNIERYADGQMPFDVIAKECARSKLKGLFSCFDTDKSLLKSEIQGIINILEESSADSSSMEMLLDLVCDKKLPPSVLFGFNHGARINKNAEKDLDKLYSAYADKKDIKSVFVPEFESEKDALESIDIGDVCQIKNNKNISIKTKEGRIKPLHISGDTFLELFPPVERYAYNQSTLGNCYMISAVDAMFQNPLTREKILETFRENEDGTLDACFMGFKEKNGNLVPKNDNGFVMKDVEKTLKKELRKNYSNMSYSCEGLRAIEVLNEKTAEHGAQKRIKKQAKTYINLFEKMNDKDYIYHDGFRYSKQEITMFLVGLYKEGPEGFISMGNKDDPPLYLHYEDVEDALYALNEENHQDNNSVFQRLVLERYKECLQRRGNIGISFKEILPKDLYFAILGQRPTNTSYIYNTGGVSTSVFAKFGMDFSACTMSSPKAKKYLYDEDANSKYVMTISGNVKIKNKYGIIPHHGYSVEPVDIDGKRKFKIRNPQNSINEIILSYNELEKYFAELDIGKI